MNNLEEIHQTMTSWIKEAATHIKAEINEQISVDVKTTPNDLVTNLDYETEKFIVEKIKEAYPNHLIVSEEGFGDNVDNLDGSVWFIDPIDGTLNFVKQKENFCIMLAYYEDGIGQLGYIYDVMKDDFYHVMRGEGAYCNDELLEPISERGLNEGLTALNSKLISQEQSAAVKSIISDTLGLRLYGSAGIEAMEVISSRTVAYVASNLMPWDFAAPNVFVHEMDARITDFENQPVNLLKPGKIIIANKKAHQEIINIFNQA